MSGAYDSARTQTTSPKSARPGSGCSSSNSGSVGHASTVTSERENVSTRECPSSSSKGVINSIVVPDGETRERIIKTQARCIRHLEGEAHDTRRQRDALVTRLALLAYKLEMYSQQSHQQPPVHGHHHPHHHHHYRHLNRSNQHHHLCHAGHRGR